MPFTVNSLVSVTVCIRLVWGLEASRYDQRIYRDRCNVLKLPELSTSRRITSIRSIEPIQNLLCAVLVEATRVEFIGASIHVRQQQ